MALHSISICSGIGGLDLGVSYVLDARVICYVEREIKAAEILVSRMEEGRLDKAPIYSDLASFDGNPWRGKVDLITAGLPCQPFSVAGKRRGESDERYIWPTFFRVIREVQPAMVFLENVPGILKWFRPIGDELCGLGYKLEAGLFTAAEVSASHKRERFFCLAYRCSERLSGSEAEREMEGKRSSERYHQVADAARLRQWAEPGNGTRDRTELSIIDVADPGDRLIPQPGRGSQGRDGAGSTELVLDDPERRHELCIRGNGTDQGAPDGGDRQADGEPGVTDEVLADAASLRCEQHREVSRSSTPRKNDRRLCKSSRKGTDFPPGPNDHEAWRKLLVRKPWMRPAISQEEIESLVRRGVNGFSEGLDRTARLRALGNAVVPAQAALALKYLLEKANG